jgi:hypothetical protein
LRIAAPLLAAALALAAAAPAMAETSAPPTGPRDAQAIGAAYSVMSGSGFRYTRSYASGWGWQAAGIGWGQGGNAFVNVGGAVTKEIDRREWGALHGLLAAGAGLSPFAGGNGLAPNLQTQFNVSPGLGFSWGPISIEAGMSLYSNAAGIGFGPGYGFGLNWWF